MPSYLCENCNERMTLQKASADTKKCPTCHKMKMKKERSGGMGGIDPGAFGF